jgi:hypothetical protein
MLTQQCESEVELLEQITKRQRRGTHSAPQPQGMSFTPGGPGSAEVARVRARYSKAIEARAAERVGLARRMEEMCSQPVVLASYHRQALLDAEEGNVARDKRIASLIAEMASLREEHHREIDVVRTRYLASEAKLAEELKAAKSETKIFAELAATEAKNARRDSLVTERIRRSSDKDKERNRPEVACVTVSLGSAIGSFFGI